MLDSNFKYLNEYCMEVKRLDRGTRLRFAIMASSEEKALKKARKCRIFISELHNIIPSTLRCVGINRTLYPLCTESIFEFQ